MNEPQIYTNTDQDNCLVRAIRSLRHDALQVHPAGQVKEPSKILRGGEKVGILFILLTGLVLGTFHAPSFFYNSYFDNSYLTMAPSPPTKTDLLLLASLFLLELSIVVMPMAMYMKGDRPFMVFLSSNPGVVFLVAIAVSLLAGAVIIDQYLASTRAPSRHFSSIVMMNLVTVILVMSTVEITLRATSGSSSEGETFLSKALLPKNWEKLSLFYRELLDRARGDLSHHVYDDLMGWTIGPNRRSADGLYWSSSEGIRAPHAGITFAKLTGRTRIALVGDSYTFGEEVAYEDTWGYLLEKGLGSEFQVLNFGVGGYGVDQAYLRYEKDVRMWKPKIVIFGFISHDATRTMMVYPFLNLPQWNTPFSKPRFIMRDGQLKPLNVPPLPPEAIFSKGSISELPFLEYDLGYKQSDWQKRLYHLSYLTRLFVSTFPDSSAVNPDVSDEALRSVNAAILKTFIQSAAQSGAIPLVVFFPHRLELGRPSSSLPLGKRVLHDADIAYTDVTPCLLELNPADRLAPSGEHYSPQGNAVVANCLRTVVNEALAKGRLKRRATIGPRAVRDASPLAVHSLSR
jgi:hypothetical protein